MSQPVPLTLSCVNELEGDILEHLILQNREAGMTQIVVTHDLQFAENISDVMIKINPK